MKKRLIVLLTIVSIWIFPGFYVKAEAITQEYTDATAYVAALEQLLSEYPAEDMEAGHCPGNRLIVHGSDVPEHGAVAVVSKGDDYEILQYASDSQAYFAYKQLVKAGYEVLWDEEITIELMGLGENNANISYISPYMQLDQMYQKSSFQKREVIVAVVDSGVAARYFGDRVLEGYNAAATDKQDEEQLKDTADNFGHGTKVASVILDNTGDNVKVLPVRIMDTNNKISVLSVDLALSYAATHADVINLSLGYVNTDAYTKTFWNVSIDTAITSGVPVVVAAGNNGTTTRGAYPACYEPCWTIGAITQGEKRASFSNYGNIDFVAPGQGIICVSNSGNLESANGTSFSAPAISALTALLMGEGVDRTVDEMYGMLQGMCKDLGSIGYDSDYGYGAPIVPKFDAVVIGTSLTLDGSIGVNLYLELDEQLTDAESSIELNGREQYIALTEESANNLCKIRQDLPASKWNDKLTVRIYNASGESCPIWDAGTIRNEYVYGVNDYIDCVLQGNYDDTLKRLVLSIRDYGICAQKYFHYKEDDMPNLSDSITNLGELHLQVAEDICNGAVQGLTYAGSSLLTLSETTIRHYFDVEDGFKRSQYRFVLDGVEVSAYSKNGQIYVDVPNIAAYNMDHEYVLKITDQEQNEMQIKYRVLDYVGKALERENEDIKNLAKAIYLYHSATKEYFDMKLP